MRNLSPTERGYLTDPEGHWCFGFAEVTNFDGTWINLGNVANGARVTDFLNTFSISDNIDANTLSMSGTFLREAGAYSLVPFRSDSPLNVDDSSAYSPLLDLHRSWRFWGVILPIDTFPSSPADYREWWSGIIDRIDIQGDPATIAISGRGMEADIIDAKIAFVDNTASPPDAISQDTPKVYAGGTVDVVIQAMLDEELGVGAVPLTVDGSAPSEFINGWTQSSDVGLMDLASQTAGVGAGLLRYKYDSSDVLSFTLFSPNRNPTTADWTTNGGEYEKLDVGIGLSEVRNYVYVRYFDATFGAPLVVTSPNASPATATSASIARFKLRTMSIDLAASTQVNAQTPAGNLADAVRADLEFPVIEHTLTGRGFWFAELGDYVQLLANGIHYDQDQYGGITSIQHTFANGDLTSVLGLRAKPAGRYRGWLDFGPGAPRTPFTPGITKYTADYWETYAIDGITLTGAGVMDLGEVNAYTRSVAIEVSTDPLFGTVEFIQYDDVTGGGTWTDQWAGASRASIYYFRATPWSGPLSAGLPTGVAGPPALARTWFTPQVPTQPAFDGAVADIATNAAAIAAETTARIAGDTAQQAYTDAKVAGLSWKQAVRAATTAAGTLASSFANGSAIDGVTLATGDRILVKNQATASENGIYTVNVSGAPTRATDADSGAELVNASCYVSEGTANADTQWTCTTNATITVGSTSLAFAQLSSGGGGVTTTGSPASGNLTKFSGSSSITNGDLTGDVTTSGTLATTLAASGASAGTYGSSTLVPVITVDAKGRITSASSTAVSASTLWRIDTTRAVTGTVDDTIEIGKFAPLEGFYLVTVRWDIAGSVVSKAYWLNATYGSTGSAWQLCYPASSSLNGTLDVDLEINVDSGFTYFRLRRSGTAGSGFTASISIEVGGNAAPTFTPSSTTSTSAITARYAERFLLTGLAQSGASNTQLVGWDDTNKKWAPTTTLPSSASLPGSPTTTTQSPADNSTKVATTAYVDAANALQANLASPTLTGTPLAPTPTVGDNSTKIATTAFVAAAIGGLGGGGQTTTASGTPATLSISSISGSFNAMLIFIEGRSNAGGTGVNVLLRFNSDSSAVYDQEQITAFSTSVSGAQVVGGTSIQVGFVPASGATANRAGSVQVAVPGYAGTVFDKTTTGTSGTDNGTGAFTQGTGTFSGTWRPATPVAITTVTASLSSGNWVDGSTMTIVLF